ncbi:Fur family transcriptional regulator, zinc uptake regulator [Roseivivax lentus]|uniref:Fur family transcriptional regulator, zinc uptake regulator n=1 Tax=Roseivivax lentus TaxID=633194 RepID=A0A1N7KWD7_9RHOB|nr:Fur family transcriptional regulator [Roseivivax lentus]SIS65857.1 Fur family transcriptional regulator, zinc uptake regulator [Roseivivax lentus]
MDTVGFARHDHDVCIETGLAAVEAQCAEAGLQLTPVRRRVLEILMQRHAAMGAYDILDILREEGLGAQPPVAYRALDFLTTHGFVHRIERLNAFVACTHPGARHAPTFLICRSCSAVAEACAAPPVAEIRSAAAELGFAIEKVAIEAEGLCPACRTGVAPCA